MQKLYKPTRIAVIFIAMAALLTLYVSALYKLQIYDSRPSEEDLFPQKTAARRVTLSAARGNIYDRNGVLLASGRPAYRITISRDEMILLPQNERNTALLSLIYAATDAGIAYNDSLPITKGAPFSYIADMTASQRKIFEAYLDYFGHPRDISASDLLNWMRNQYSIDYTIGISDARLISGVRYELETRAIVTNLSTYVFAPDVGADFVSIVKERSYPGVDVTTTWVREYKTNSAAHVMGFTGLMNPDEYELYKEFDYPMDAVVGKLGVEQAFETYLHGVDGMQIVTTSDTGAVLDVRTTQDPVPGANVYLTLDIELQEFVESAMKNHIETVDLEREEGDKIKGGAAVVTDVKTGELLACASYPTYDLITVLENLGALNNDPTSPMLNRATQGIYNPGSTFKMVTALTGLRTGSISRWTQIDDTGKYTKYSDYQPACWIFPLTGHGHGPLDVLQALEKSCNYFFCQIGDIVGPSAMAAVASDFGLGQKTGIEIAEKVGTLATPEVKRQIQNLSWYDADTLLASFGQGINQFTPIQLANYTATIANGGTRNALTILSKIKSADFSELMYSHTPEILGEIPETEYLGILQSGMVAVAKTGTAADVFGDYPISVAAKTGTVQSDTAVINNAVFVCYAPANNPEIAISIVVEKGGSGAAIMSIAKEILDYYFRITPDTPESLPGELVP